MDVEQRLNLQEMREHAFFEGIDFDNIHEQKPPPFGPYSLKLIFPDDTENKVSQNNNTPLDDDQNEDASIVEDVDYTNGENGKTMSPSQPKKELTEEEKKWSCHLNEDEEFVKLGMISKKRKMSVKKRILILTSKPRLFYVDPKDNQVKGFIELTAETKVQLVTGKDFEIEVPKRVYKIEDTEKNATDWVEKLKKVLKLLKN